MSSKHPKSAWTDPLVEQLETLWAAGELSCTGIAAALGHGITRNAVIGKVGRLGLEKRVRNPYPQNRRSRAPRAIRKNGTGYVATRALIENHDVESEAVRGRGSLSAIEAEATPDTFLGIPLLSLKDHHCRYPRDIEGERLFCGQPKTFTIAPDGTSAASSYCAHCHARCHTGDFGRRSSNYVFARRAA